MEGLTPEHRKKLSKYAPSFYDSLGVLTLGEIEQIIIELLLHIPEEY